MGKLWTNLSVWRGVKKREYGGREGRTFSLAMVSMTSSGGVPRSSVIIENWFTSTLRQSTEKKRKETRTVLSREQRLPLQHLRKYATSTPDVNGHIVLLPCQHNLRGTIISRRDISCHLRILDACQTKVAYLPLVSHIRDEANVKKRTLRSQFSLTRILLGF